MSSFSDAIERLKDKYPDIDFVIGSKPVIVEDKPIMDFVLKNGDVELFTIIEAETESADNLFSKADKIMETV